jgi:hypothetical protein
MEVNFEGMKERFPSEFQQAIPLTFLIGHRDPMKLQLFFPNKESMTKGRSCERTTHVRPSNWTRTAQKAKPPTILLSNESLLTSC